MNATKPYVQIIGQSTDDRVILSVDREVAAGLRLMQNEYSKTAATNGEVTDTMNVLAVTGDALGGVSWLRTQLQEALLKLDTMFPVAADVAKDAKPKRGKTTP